MRVVLISFSFFMWCYTSQHTRIFHRHMPKEKKLLRACQDNRTVCAQQLLALCANPNASDYNGMVPLMWAAYHDNDILIMSLLSAQANPNMPTMSPMLFTDKESKVYKLLEQALLEQNP